MKKTIIKLGIFLSVFIFTLISLNLHLSEQEKKFSLLTDNIEALATPETGGGNVLVGDCWGSVVIIPDCKVTCVCGKVYYAQPRVPHATPHNVTGRCSCGNTIFPQ